MALIICPECRRSASDKAAACPHCGYALRDADGNPLFKPESTISARKMVVFTAAVAVIAGGLIIYREQTRHTEVAADGRQVGTSTPALASSFRVIDDGKENLRTQLRDPDSARFGATWEGGLERAENGETAQVACGLVNARNGFGGMTGNQRFISARRGFAMVETSAHEPFFEKLWRETCIENRRE